MSFISIVHGRIISGISLNENRNFINSLDKNQTFPWIMSEMFGFQDLNSPYYFNHQMITFGATYKQVEDD